MRHLALVAAVVGLIILATLAWLASTLKDME